MISRPSGTGPGLGNIPKCQRCLVNIYKTGASRMSFPCVPAGRLIGRLNGRFTCNITCSVGRRGQRRHTRPELSKSSKMSNSEHANLAEYIERPLFGAPISLRNPFGEITFLRECLKSAQNATGTSQMHFSSKFELKTFCQKFGIFENDNLFEAAQSLLHCPYYMYYYM